MVNIGSNRKFIYRVAWSTHRIYPCSDVTHSNQAALLLWWYMNEGYIKLYRSMLDWEWYSETNTMVLFLHLLLKANYEDKRWMGVEIKRGQLITSLATLKEETTLSIRNIRTSLKRLKSTHEVTVETTHHYTIITINNYNTYQSESPDGDTASDTASDKQVTSKRQASDTRVTTTKEVKNERINTFSKESKEKFLSEKFSFDAKIYANFFKDLLPSSQKVTESMFSSWEKTYIELLEKDKRDKDEVYSVTEWARRDVFWGRNFLSASKLRRKNKEGVFYYDIFLTQMKGVKKHEYNPQYDYKDSDQVYTTTFLEN